MGYISGNQNYIDNGQKSLDFIKKTIDENLMSNVSAINLLNEDKIDKRNYYCEK